MAPESFNIKDAGAAIIQLHEDGHSDLLNAASQVMSASTELDEAVQFNNHLDPLHPLVDEYQLSANADAYISSNALTVVEAEAVYNVSPPAYSIDDNYTNIKAAFSGGALISAAAINAVAETISEAVEIFAPEVAGGAAIWSKATQWQAP